MRRGFIDWETWGTALAIVAALALVVGGLVWWGFRTSIRPAAHSLTTNHTAQVDVLFTDADGYTVKGFRDGGEYHYYVTPGPARVETMRRRMVGKVMVTERDAVETAP
jgi:hypothetical protein